MSSVFAQFVLLFPVLKFLTIEYPDICETGKMYDKMNVDSDETAI